MKEIFLAENFLEIRGLDREISTQKYTTGQQERSGFAAKPPYLAASPPVLWRLEVSVLKEVCQVVIR